MLNPRPKQKKFKHKLQYGFTLAELLIVVAIIGILAAFGFVSVYQYQKNLHLKELDDTAQEIYVAAQNHLTVAKANGEWDEFYHPENETNDSESGDKYGTQMEQPSDYPSSVKFDDKEHHDYRYFRVGDSSAEELQDYFLPKNAIDDTIRPSSADDTHAIVIEYDAKSAIVYAVWYTDGKSGWFGSPKKDSVSKITKNRPVFEDNKETSESLKNRRNTAPDPQVGYYGGGTRVDVNGNTDQVSQPKVQIVNADILYVRVKRDKKSSDKQAKISSLVIQFKGDTSSKKNISAQKQHVGELLSVNKNQPDFYEGSDKKIIQFNESDIANAPRDAAYDCYIIDSVTNGENKHFASLFGKDNGDLIPGENLTISVYKVKGIKVKYKTFHVNSLFDSITNEQDQNANNSGQTNNYTANIKYGRQLQNLSTAVSGVKDDNNLHIQKASLTSNLDWSRFYFNQQKKNDDTVWEKRDVKHGNSSYDINVLKTESGSSLNTGITAFYSIVNDNLQEFDGNNHTISNLQMQKDSDANGAGLFGSNHNHALTIHDLTMTDPSFEQRSSGSAIRYAGVLVGKNFEDDNKTASLTIENVKVNSSSDKVLSVTGTAKNSGDNREGAAGILVGHSNSSSIDISDAEINLKNGATIRADKGGNAGGLVGDISDDEVTIKDSFIKSTKPLNIQAEQLDNSMDNGNAGGAVGYLEYKNNYHLENLQISSDDTLQIIGNRNAGGLLGVSWLSGDKASSNAEIKNCAVYGGGDKDQVKGSAFVGGFAGYINAKDGIVTISDNLASMYVRKDEKLIPTDYVAEGSNNAGVGGFIGTVRTGSEQSVIQNSYAGGRTTKGIYSDKVGILSKDPGEENQGRFNVQWLHSNNQDVALGGAGGFIGTFYNAGKDGKITISNSYTTASVYADNNAASVGSFGGRISDDYDVTMHGTYSTGLVSGNSPKYIGGENNTANVPSDNYYLDGVNKQEFSDSNAEKAYAGEVNTPFADGQKSEARTYDSSLNDKSYPFTSVTSAGIDEENNIHFGDWFDISNQNVINDDAHTVQFFDEDGTPLTDVLHINDGASVRQQVPSESSMNVPEGKKFDGWYTNNTDFSQKIDDSIFDNVTSDIKAYAHYVMKDNYVTLHYVDPTDASNQKIGTIGVAKINNNTVTEPQNIRRFGGFSRNTDWNTSSDGNGVSYSVNDNKIQGVTDAVKDLYLRYHGNDMVTISLEIRADNGNTYPQIYQSYIYEYPKGTSYDFSQSLDDFENAYKNVGYALEEDGLKRRNLSNTSAIELQSVNGSEASLNASQKTVTLQGTADEDKTYVVLYTGRSVNYTINHVFEDSIGNDGSTTLSTGNFNLTDINSKMQYAKGKTFTVTETRSGTIGEFINLESELDAAEDMDTGFKISLKDTDFVLNQGNQVFTIDYSRKEYQLTIDTNGAEVVADSPVSVPFGADISASSTYLNGLPHNQRRGYTLQKDRSGQNVWSYTQTEDGTPYNGTTMPAANVTATANWTPNTTAPYTVEVWMQKVDASQTVGMNDADKEYDFYGSFDVAANDSVTLPGSRQRVRLTADADVGTTPSFLNNADVTTALVNGKLSDASSELKYFTVNTVNAQNRNDTDGKNDTNSGIVTIRPDGTTVYRVFYDRKTITFNFNYGNNYYQQLYVRREWNQDHYEFSLTTDASQIYDYITTDNYLNYMYLLSNYSNQVYWGTVSNGNAYITTWVIFVDSYQGLYGQQFKEAADIFNNYYWNYNNRTGNSNLTSLMNYILPGDSHDDNSETTLTLNCRGTNNGTLKINHYREDLNGNWVLTTETKSESNGNFNLTNKYDGFTVYGFCYNTTLGDTVTGNIDINTDEKNTQNTYNRTNRSQRGTLNIFHKRNSSTITLMNVNPMNDDNVKLSDGFSIDGNNKISVHFEQPLKDIGLPTDPNLMHNYIPKSVDQNEETKDYSFGGWYTSASFAEGTEFNGDDTMPNHNIRLYAKWNAPTYTVNYMDGNTSISSETVDRYGMISLVNADALSQVYKKDGYTFAGWFTKPDLSEGSEYLPNRAVTDNLTLYAKFTKAAGTNVTYTVKYVFDDKNKTEASPSKTVQAVIGNNYDERPIDIPNAVCLDVRRSGPVTEALDGETIIFHYRMYAGSSWKYTIENQVTYRDIDSDKTQDATISSTEQSTSYASKYVNADNLTDYLVDGDASKSVTRSRNKVTFNYIPDYDALKLTNFSEIYGDSSGPTFTRADGSSITGAKGWAVPDGWHLETRTTYKDSDGKEIETPKNAGTYKADVSLYLVKGNDTMCLYTRKNLTYRILKRTVILVSNNGAVTVDPTCSGWAEGEGATYDIDKESNTFTYTLNSGTSANNYNIYRKFGTAGAE